MLQLQGLWAWEPMVQLHGAVWAKTQLHMQLTREGTHLGLFYKSPGRAGGRGPCEEELSGMGDVENDKCLHAVLSL